MPDHAGTLIGVVVEPADAGRRLDQVLADRIVDLSRTRVKALVLAGAVAIGGRSSSMSKGCRPASPMARPQR